MRGMWRIINRYKHDYFLDFHNQNIKQNRTVNIKTKNHHVWTWIDDLWEWDPFSDEYLQETERFVGEVVNPKEKWLVEDWIFHDLGFEIEEILRTEIKGDEV
jgi:hypothetical protein